MRESERESEIEIERERRWGWDEEPKKEIHREISQKVTANFGSCQK